MLVEGVVVGIAGGKLTHGTAVVTGNRETGKTFVKYRCHFQHGSESTIAYQSQRSDSECMEICLSGLALICV